jgi:hypothetical protein
VADAKTDTARKTIIAVLTDLGIEVPREKLSPRWREWRWIMEIGGEGICYFAETDYARVRLERERQLLCALEGRVACAIPSILAASGDGRLQVRRMVLGDQIQDREFATGTSQGWERIAETYGIAIAALHAAIDPGRGCGPGSATT